MYYSAWNILRSLLLNMLSSLYAYKVGIYSKISEGGNFCIKKCSSQYLNLATTKETFSVKR